MGHHRFIGALLACAVLACGEPTAPSAGPPSAPPSSPLIPPSIDRTTHVVAVDGRASNTGDATAPWDLATALSGASGRVSAGDTIWIRGGTYSGTFVSTVSGTETAPVLVRVVPGERAILSHAGASLNTLSVRGAWITLWGLEVTNPEPNRTSPITASEWRPNGVVNSAQHVRYVRFIVHDAGVGFYNYPSAQDVEVTGSIFYNNGWQAPDRGHGHAIYVKSNSGPVTLRHNVVFNQYGWGVHAYADAGSGRLDGIVVEENVLIDNGALASTPSGANLLLGGETPSDGSRIVGNIGWFSASARRTNAQVGYGGTENGTLRMEQNTFVGGDPVLRVGRWSAAALRANTLAGAERIVQVDDPTPTGLDWRDTRQARDPLALAWGFGSLLLPHAVWSATTGLGLGDIVSIATPAPAEVRVWPDRDEPGRAIVVVLNWSRAASVEVPLAGVLTLGEPFEVRHAQDPFGAVLASGINTGSVALPMTGVEPPRPIGGSPSSPARTGPDFNVFLISKP